MNKNYKTLIRLPEVIKRTGVSRTTIYRLIHKNSFPSPIKISEKTIAFVESEVNDWIEKLIHSSRNKAA
ncbi:helix-turn-helix transcriptional regulator [Citrobacter sedlakii]|uniref:helix-turn-helix transcriptional regulator n=1 Tax=Citrobacter sedlakii TaxID=67826 RepID=UPI002B237192|nr:AlpA family transcriptional regulator [Citrobacter sedlakii]MEB0949541.1 AlpA family transcriptional regulator [Citrobacter sedlakii]